MANYIELITKYSSQAWDKVYKKEAISSMFDAQPGLFQFTGAKTVKAKRTPSGKCELLTDSIMSAFL